MAEPAHAQPQQPIIPLGMADSRQLLKLAAMPLIHFTKPQMIDELCLRGSRLPNGSLANSKSQFRDKKIGRAWMQAVRDASLNTNFLQFKCAPAWGEWIASAATDHVAGVQATVDCRHRSSRHVGPGRLASLGLHHDRRQL